MSFNIDTLQYPPVRVSSNPNISGYRVYLTDRNTQEPVATAIYSLPNVVQMIASLTISDFDELMRLFPESIKEEMRNRL